MNPSLNTHQSMTSLEISELVQSRHDNVKRTIETLVKQAVITSPQIEEKPTAGRPSTFYIFTGEKGKRDSIIVVAQLCPEFTAKLVDRWHELETQSQPKLPQTYVEALRDLADTHEKLALQAPKVEFYDKMIDCTNLSSATQVASKYNLTARELNSMLFDLDVYSRGVDPKKGKVFRKWFIKYGYGEMKHNVGYGIQPMFTAKGEQWIVDNI
jgi:phage regulator Rha-like protein